MIQQEALKGRERQQIAKKYEAAQKHDHVYSLACRETVRETDRQTDKQRER